MIELSMIRDLVAIFGVIAGFSYYVMTVRTAQKNQKDTLETRQTQLFMQLYYEISSLEFRNTIEELLNRDWTDFNDYMTKYGPDENPDAWHKFRTGFSRYEHIGILVRDGMINPELIWTWVGSIPLHLWEKYEPFIFEYREKYETPPKGMWFEWFEDLTYAIRDEREKDRRDVKQRLLRRRSQREALGLSTY